MIERAVSTAPREPSSSTQPDLDSVAMALADGAAVDWTRLDTQSGAARQLHIVQQVFDASGVSSTAAGWRIAAYRLLMWTIICKTTVHLAAWTMGYSIAPATAALSPIVHGLVFVGFLCPAFVLVAFGRFDRRASYLGLFFIVIALAFAREPATALANDIDLPALAPLKVLLRSHLDSLLPLLFWLFVREFPHKSAALPLRRISTAFAGVSAAVGIGLLVLDVLWLFDILRIERLRAMGNAYFLLTFGLTLPACPVVLYRSLRARGPDRFRAAWFAAGLVVGLGPLFVEVAAEALVPVFRAWARRPDVRPALGAVLFTFLLTIPATSVYAVVFKRVLDVRLVVRRALRFVMARNVFIAGSIAPLVCIAWSGYHYRTRTIMDVAHDPVVAVLLALSIGGVVALTFAGTVSAALERRFFRTPYDGRAILTRIAPHLARAVDSGAVARLVADEIDTALQPERTIVLVRDRASGAYVDSVGSRRLPADSRLIELLARLPPTGTLDVTNALFRRVSVGDAAWLVASGAELLVPLRGGARRVDGVIAVGEKRSELPYFDEDRQFLAGIAGPAALALENQELRVMRHAQSIGGIPPSERALECAACGTLQTSDGPTRCERCGGLLELSVLPIVVVGKFRLRHRLGKGGMGVVYAAVDTTLNRWVAIKALPYISEAANTRLRREAQAMAQVTHPHLATIYGCETADEQPLLVVEYLRGGTLAERLEAERPSAPQVVQWGLDLCDGLHCLHSHQLLHGDIKPSNIGFTADRAVKLLDFGLTDTFVPRSETDADRERRGVHGTPFYLCPEAFLSMAPCPQFDLWSLALVLYESLAGPAFRASLAQPAHRASLPDIRTFRPDVPDALAAFFERALHLDLDARPATALEFSLWLQQARPIV